VFRDLSGGDGGGLRIRGVTAEILWGYHTAAVLGAWAIEKASGQWTLSAKLARVDKFRIRQTSPRLSFSAPRPGGFWVWDIFDLQIGETRLVAKLGPPIQ
jgi:hypothetical protein